MKGLDESLQIGRRVHLVEFATFEYREEYRRRIGSLGRVGSVPSFAANHRVSQNPLRRIIIDREIFVGEKESEPLVVF